MTPPGGPKDKPVRRRTERAIVLVRLTRDGQELFEGEIEPGHSVEIGELRLHVLWIRHSKRRNEVPADLP